MDIQLIVIIVFTFIIHLIGTLAYSARIAGTRTGQIAVSFALFNIMILISRTSNSFQGPLLGKRIEESISAGVMDSIVVDFRLIIFSATIATIVGTLTMPSFQRLFTRAVNRFKAYGSVPKLAMRGFTPTGLSQIINSITIPTKANILGLGSRERIPLKFIIFNMIATAVWTIGVLSSLYAGCLEPELRLTSSQLSSIINGIATILMFIYIDPHVAVMTDDVAKGDRSQAYFRRSIVWLLGSRLLGTLLAQVLLHPAAIFIVEVARII
ncbi:lipid II flippase Amj family protein [Spartinivicinus poritis]|uniref:Lipid II flippase Amj n=1 Tax=Spartinivicinus poritis TaxID=2994640 RepID=A0ABT5UDU3_9GAMM|nr:lipid II flippase Amj family protein [Spartinivicinus sp. A2-2]MDE1463648.1 lipid II flippase Amj family protein [Spartinivicinus sp. A2-2]